MLHTVIVILLFNVGCLCEVQQMGPDPWNYENDVSSKIENDAHVPPDLRLVHRRKEVTDNNIGMSDRFFKRMLTIVLKFGQVQQNEDGSVDVSVQMRFDPKRWQLLNEYTASNTALSDEMYRRTLGYIEEAIYKPTVIDKLVMAWSDYIQFYIVEYKIQITWILGICAVVGTLVWLWNHMSHKHMIIIIFVALYLYEGFISYKEAEQQEVQMFLSAMNTCKWRFWSSECEVPPPDPLVFLKHMNPLKIAIRMFTNLISEPMIVISETMKTMIHGITDGLWFPFDRIVYGILIVSFNLLLVFLLIMIVFNYIFNIPFKLSIFAGLVSVGMKERNRTLISENNNNQTQIPRVEGDRISGATLDKLLDVCSRALTTTRVQPTLQLTGNTSNLKIKRSSSAGRLYNITSTSFCNEERPALEGIRKRNAPFYVGHVDGSGDHRL